MSGKFKYNPQENNPFNLTVSSGDNSVQVPQNLTGRITETHFKIPSLDGTGTCILTWFSVNSIARYVSAALAENSFHVLSLNLDCNGRQTFSLDTTSVTTVPKTFQIINIQI